MTKFEFRAIPCPERALRQRDLPAGADAFCETLSAAINDLAGEGWDYVRAETIEVKTRRGFRTRKADRTFLVFRREIEPLFAARPATDVGRDVERVRARRVKSGAVVEFVRGGGRRIATTAANSDTQSETMGYPVSAAE